MADGNQLKSRFPYSQMRYASVVNGRAEVTMRRMEMARACMALARMAVSLGTKPVYRLQGRTWKRQIARSATRHLACGECRRFAGNSRPFYDVGVSETVRASVE